MGETHFSCQEVNHLVRALDIQIYCIKSTSQKPGGLEERSLSFDELAGKRSVCPMTLKMALKR